MISVILCTQGCMLKHSLGAFSFGKMTLGPNERDTSSITYCGRSLASSAPFRGGVVDLTFLLWALKYLQFFRLHVYPLFNMQKKEAAFFCNAASRAKKGRRRCSATALQPAISRALLSQFYIQKHLHRLRCSKLPSR